MLHRATAGIKQCTHSTWDTAWHMCVPFIFYLHSLSQAHFSCKGPDNKYFRLCKPRGKIKDILGTYIARERKKIHILLTKLKM